MDTKHFLSTIFGDADGYLFISTKDDAGELTQHKAFKYPEALNRAEAYVSVRTDEDVFFSPMLYRVPNRKSEAVSITPVVYSDTDLFDPNDFLVRPSINVRSSTDKSHSYWLLDKQYTPDEVSTAARAIALTHAKKINGEQAGTDPSGWMLTKLLRVPGTMNTKTSLPEPYVVNVEWSDGTMYSLEDIVSVYDGADIPEKIVASDEPMPTADELPAMADVLRRMAHDSMLMGLYTETPRGDWSDTLYLLESEMFRDGYTAAEVFVVAWHAACNKYQRDGRPESDLWHEVRNAGADPANRPRARVPIEAYNEPRPKDEGLIATQLEVTLLSEDERIKLTRTFVDDYVDWGATRTDAPAPYHVAGAFAIMSCVLGEFGVAYPRFGSMRLGMSLQVLGETTDTRKSTSRFLMKDTLRPLQMGDYKYLLTSDTTPESLLDALSDRPDQSSLYDRDETQQLINDIKHKPYLQGFFETLNELYDGWARGRLRSTKATEDTRVNFVAYMMGIRSQVQDELEVKDFLSGWGPRQIFFRGESPPRTRADKYLPQGNPSGSNADPAHVKLIRTLVDARNYWHKQVPDRAYPLPILFEADAWDRWNTFAADAEDYVAHHPRGEMISPSVKRLAFATMKAAIMFAMMDKREKANMQDVLNAIYFSLQWIEDLIIVVEGVAESAAARDLAMIEKYIIDKGGIVTYASLLKWSTSSLDMRRGDFDECLRILVDMGTIDEVQDAKGKRSYAIV